MTRKKDKQKEAKAAKATTKKGGERRLSVSYGAFSCTLEGYENPLAIVEALTDRFRAVTSAEPRFALAPPPLDMDMLRQIAEAELRRQVEAGLLDAATIVDLARAEPEDEDHRSAARRTAPRPEPEDAELADPPEAETAHAPDPAAGNEARRRSRRAEVIAQLRAAVHQAATDQRRAAPRRAAGAEAAPPAASKVEPPPASKLPPLQLGPALRADGTGAGAAPGAVRLPSAPSAQLRAYPEFADAPDTDARLMATARYLTEIEGRIGFDAAHLVALLHANSSGTDAATCRAALDRALAAGRLARLAGARIGLAPGSL